MTWSDVDWAATEAAVGRIQDRIFRAAKTKRQRLEPDAEQSARPVLRGALDSNVVAPTRLRLRADRQARNDRGWPKADRARLPQRSQRLGSFDPRPSRGLHYLGRVREEPAPDHRQR